MTESQEATALLIDPFEGDFGSPGDRVFKDRFGRVRKAGPCNDCSGIVKPGERARLLSAIFDGSLRNYRWCAACCEAAVAEREEPRSDETHRS